MNHLGILLRNMVYRTLGILKTAYRSSLILVMVVLLFVGCGGDSDEGVSQPPEDVEQAIRQFSLMQSRAGRAKWKLTADSATFLESDRVAIEGVELLIYGDEDGETMTIYGDSGTVNERTYDFTITGNVRGISSDGDRLNTEELHWRDRTGKIYTSPGVEVTITHKDSVIVGEELIASPRFETVRLRKMTGITTRMEEKESETSAD